DPAGEPLQDPEHDHLAEAAGLAAQRRKQQKQRRVDDQIASQGKHPAEEVGHRNHDDLADQIGGRYPGAIDAAGADAAFDIGQRGMGDLDVEHGEKRAEQPTADGDPGLQRDGGLATFAQRGHDALLPDDDANETGLVSMVGSTDMPGRSRPNSGSFRSISILTGIRWTVLVKLPVALSGGNTD